MSGCYGNDPEDKFFESRLLDHLDPRCEDCGSEDCECKEIEPPCPFCEEASDKCRCDDE